jgi:NADH-quinone oxidoreductase subunit C
MDWLNVDKVLAALAERFTGVDFQPAALAKLKDAARQQTCIRIAPERLIEVMRFLHDDERCRFDQLSDLTCVDYLNFPNATDRYGVTYTLLSTRLGHRLWAKCFVNDPDPELPSVTGIWRGANWLEREVWDLFGIKFTGHPDLRRIMTWESFAAHPLRKDYPLRGRGERESYERIGRDSA